MDSSPLGRHIILNIYSIYIPLYNWGNLVPVISSMCGNCGGKDDAIEGVGERHLFLISIPLVSAPASEEANGVTVTNCHFIPLEAPTSVEFGRPGFRWLRQTQQKPILN